MKTVKIVALAAVAGAIALAAAGPANAISEKMYGDPAAAAQYWRYQQYSDDCVLMSSADVVGELTGALPPEEAIIDMAHSTPSSQAPGLDLHQAGQPQRSQFG